MYSATLIIRTSWYHKSLDNQEFLIIKVTLKKIKILLIFSLYSIIHSHKL